MSYPPPGYPPPYPNGNHNYPYGQPPPAAYYGSQQPPPGYYVVPNRSSACARGILAALTLLVFFLFFSTIITWIVLRPQLPTYQVTNFTVSNFNVTGSSLAAQWSVNLTVNNPNTKLKVYFDRIHGYMFYKGGSDETENDDILATSQIIPFLLNINEKSNMNADFSTTNPDQPMVASWVMDDLRKARSNGTVPFNFRMMVWSTFRTGGWWTRHLNMRVYCEELNVGFVSSSNNGTMSSKSPVDCEVYV